MLMLGLFLKGHSSLWLAMPVTRWTKNRQFINVCNSCTLCSFVSLNSFKECLNVETFKTPVLSKVTKQSDIWKGLSVSSCTKATSFNK